MPRSRRQRPVSLSKTKKQTAEDKSSLVEDIRSALDTHEHVYVFAVHNMRVEKMNRVRATFKDSSRFFMGKNKVMAVALGRSVEQEHKLGLARVAEHLVGNCALMCSNEPLDTVRAAFADFGESDFARAGFVASATVSYDAGPLPQFAHTMDQYLRKLGMPVMLKKGTITLDSPYTVCTVGQALSSEQAQLLKLLDVKMATFAFTLTCHWHDGQFDFLHDPRDAQRLAITGASAGDDDADMQQQQQLAADDDDDDDANVDNGDDDEE
jgi:mRNA turnover protein 4